MSPAPSLLLLFLGPSPAGYVPDRLVDSLGPSATDLIHRRLVRDLLQGLQGLDPGCILRILHDPSQSESSFRSWIQDLLPPCLHPLQFASQISGDQSDRLRHAFRETFAEGFARVFAISSLCPSITLATLRQASQALDEVPVIFGPSTNGGYYLLGCSRFEPRLFDVSWGTPVTLRTSLARAAESGMAARQLSPLPEITSVFEWEAYKDGILDRTPVPHSPLSFLPLYQERVWGGRTLETKLSRSLPPGRPIGEAWELVDRPEAQSLVTDGPFMGFTLEDLWTQRREDIFGPGLEGDRFPLLIKILDAREDLSLQVHPPEKTAAALGGEPKSEMWYIAATSPGARLFAGLREGVTPDAFRAALANGTAAALVHALKPLPGDYLFLPSGRLHAIGAGLLIYEIQQNSDTTYRVFDWNRLGLDGQPRQLHLDEALHSIDFQDQEPSLSRPQGDCLVRTRPFQVRRWQLLPHQTRAAQDSRHFAVITVVQGAIQCGSRFFREGDSFLIPASAAFDLDLRAGEAPATILHTTIPTAASPPPQRIDLPREHAGFYQDLRRRILHWAESRSGTRHPWFQYILLAPDFFHLLLSLASDREVPAKLKTLVLSAIAYFVLPLDLFPEAFFGPIAYLDDIALAAFAVNQLLNHLNPDIIRRHWAGQGDVLSLVQSIIARVDSMIGAGLVRQIRRMVRL